jgi:hypothetical protein
MQSSPHAHPLAPDPRSVLRERHPEVAFIAKLVALKYEYRRDITDRAPLQGIVEYRREPHDYPQTPTSFKEQLYN